MNALLLRKLLTSGVKTGGLHKGGYRKIVTVIPEGCMMRIGLTNPPYILNHLEAIAGYLNHPRVYGFLHVPVQSGSDSVLYAMKREYSNADFCKVVDTLRAMVPGVNIATGTFFGTGWPIFYSL